jgi:hypothetical protein
MRSQPTAQQTWTAIFTRDAGRRQRSTPIPSELLAWPCSKNEERVVDSREGPATAREEPRGTREAVRAAVDGRSERAAIDGLRCGARRDTRQLLIRNPGARGGPLGGLMEHVEAAVDQRGHHAQQFVRRGDVETSRAARPRIAFVALMSTATIHIARRGVSLLNPVLPSKSH